MTTQIPHDEDAEAAVLGSMLMERSNIGVALEILNAGDFYKPVHGGIFAAMERLYKLGDPIDAITVENAMHQVGLPIKDPSIFITLVGEVPSLHASHLIHYAKIVEAAARGRDVMRAAQVALASVTEGGDPFEISDELSRTLLTLGSKDVGQQAMTIQELVESDNDIADIVIPGLLKVDHRAIITAKSGSGKSTLLKMIGMCASQGVQPFERFDMEPIRVLAIDAENPTENITQTMVPLRETLRRRSLCFDEDRFRVLRRPGGMNVRNRRDFTDLQREIALHKPDLVVAGPVYKLSRRASREGYEEAAEGFIDVWDSLRIKYKFALILEAHVSKNTEDWTPQGSVELAQWTEIGMALKPQGEFPHYSWELDPYRGERLQNLRWPKGLLKDDDWLYEAVF